MAWWSTAPAPVTIWVWVGEGPSRNDNLDSGAQHSLWVRIKIWIKKVAIDFSEYFSYYSDESSGC